MDTTHDITQAASAMGKKGGKRGGPARAARMTAEERQESARHAALTRWQSKFPADNSTIFLTATHGSPDRPLRIGEIEIPCYVLEDGRRIIIQNGMMKALGMVQGSRGTARGDRLVNFVSGKGLSPFISRDLYALIQQPLFVRLPTGHRAYGYEATVLAEMCEAVLTARDEQILTKRQLHIAARCDILMRGFARVGIIALVDEATGYQESRDRDELHRILAAYIAPELLPWAQRFPDEFYVQICRLRNWTYNRIYKGPRRIAQITNQLIYDKLPPGVVEELRRLNPPVYKGYSRKHRHHQFLTENIGNPHLEKHMGQVVVLLRASTDWPMFEQLFERAFPVSAAPLALPEPEPDVIDVPPALVEG